MSATDIRPTATTIAEMAGDYNRRMKGPDLKTYIPPLILKSLEDYFKHHLPVGGFLTCVLQNNLIGAITYGDDESVFALPAIVSWIVMNYENKAWGNEHSVEEWLKQ